MGTIDMVCCHRHSLLDCGCGIGIDLAFVTLQHQYVGYPRQLKVYECILGIIESITVTQYMRNHRNTITVMYGSSHGHRTGTATY